jgi:hypothetical protein
MKFTTHAFMRQLIKSCIGMNKPILKKVGLTMRLASQHGATVFGSLGVPLERMETTSFSLTFL